MEEWTWNFFQLLKCWPSHKAIWKSETPSGPEYSGSCLKFLIYFLFIISLPFLLLSVSSHSGWCYYRAWGGVGAWCTICWMWVIWFLWVIIVEVNNCVITCNDIKHSSWEKHEHYTKRYSKPQVREYVAHEWQSSHPVNPRNVVFVAVVWFFHKNFPEKHILMLVKHSLQ